MNFHSLETHLSKPRLHRYFLTCHDQRLAAELYKMNMEVAQAFHPLLGTFEVALRNHLSYAVGQYFNDPEWVVNQQSGFMADPRLARGNFSIQRAVRNAIRNILRCGRKPGTNQIISELMFGFWTELFEPHHYSLVGGSPIHAFAHLPRGTQRVDLLNRLTKVRRFRNRVNHNESVILLNSSVDCLIVRDIHQTLEELLVWIDPDLWNFIKSLDNVDQVIAKCTALYDSRFL